MKLTFEMDPHNVKDVTTLSHISRALDWEEFPADEEGDEEAPYPVGETPTRVDGPKHHSAPGRPRRTRRSRAEIEAEKEAKATEEASKKALEEASKKALEEASKKALEEAAESPKEEPKVEQPEPLGFGAPPPVDSKVLRNQLLDTMMALHKLYQAGNGAPINNVINAFKARCNGGKFDNVNDVPDDLLPEVISFADKQLRG